MGDLVASLFDISFSIFGFNIDLGNIGTTVRDMCKWGTLTSSDFWVFAEGINKVIVPIGLSLLGVFFMLELMKKATTDIERLSWERVAMIFVKFAIFKMLVTSSFVILSMIMNVGNDMLNSVLTVITDTGGIPSLTEQIANLIDDAGGWFESALMSIIVLIMYIPFMGTLIGVVVQILLRMGKIVVAFAFAPVPTAIGFWEDGQSVTKRFYMTVCGLALDASIIVVGGALYSKGIASVDDASAISSLIALMILNGALLAWVSTASQWASSWTGGGN